jgi:hypothetical protein
VKAESLALIAECVECGRPWLPAERERWFANLTDDEPPEIAFFCSECAAREFGDN